MFTGVTNDSNACLLIALKQLFDAPPYYGCVDWGEEQLIDLYIRDGERGFTDQDFTLVEQYAPIIRILDGKYYMSCHLMYLIMYNKDRDVMYGLLGSRKIIYCYRINDTRGHAVCISTEDLPTWVQHTKLGSICIPTDGLITNDSRIKQGIS